MIRVHPKSISLSASQGGGRWQKLKETKFLVTQKFASALERKINEEFFTDEDLKLVVTMAKSTDKMKFDFSNLPNTDISKAIRNYVIKGNYRCIETNEFYF